MFVIVTGHGVSVDICFMPLKTPNWVPPTHLPIYPASTWTKCCIDHCSNMSLGAILTLVLLARTSPIQPASMSWPPWILNVPWDVGTSCSHTEEGMLFIIIMVWLNKFYSITVVCIILGIYSNTRYNAWRSKIRNHRNHNYILYYF